MLRLLLTFTFSTLIIFINAQDNALTVKDYQKAESMMGYNTQQYIDRGNVNANWFGDDKFWYRVLTPEGSEFVVVDAAKGTRTVAFDHAKLAAILSSSTGKTYKPSMLPFQSITYSADGSSIFFRAEGKQWKYDLKNNTVAADTTQVRTITGGQGGGRFRGGGGNEVRSPDGSKAAFIKEYNLWVRDIATNKLTQLLIMRGGQAATGRYCVGRRIQKRSRRSNRINEMLVICISLQLMSVIRH